MNILLLAVVIAVFAAFATAAEPSATLEQDLQRGGPSLVKGYADRRPRLLFGPGDRAALKARIAAQPRRWQLVVDRCPDPAKVPGAEDIKNGVGYWSCVKVQSGAMVAWMNDDQTIADATIQWMLAYCRQDTWGAAYRPNLDLEASWYLYHVAIGYDLLHDRMTDADRRTIRDGLAQHAKVMADDFDPRGRADRKYYFDQNHTYIPATALTAASLALLGEVPEAAEWLKISHAVMNRCRYVLGSDGYYYEGMIYWAYALHWHVRYADLMGRATGQNLLDLPALRDTWRFALHLSLPDFPGLFDISDSTKWTQNRKAWEVNNHGLLWAIAAATNSPESRTAGDWWETRRAETDYAASALLWFSPDVTPKPLEQITPYHHFTDHDVVTWRSGWGRDDTALLFRCGPPEGHAAATKLKRLTDWKTNAGHVHPDIGAFYLYAKGTYLATATGYTMQKFTKDHNTLLIDGVGQGADGKYHNDQGVPYEHFDACKMEAVHLAPTYGYARGTFGSAYTRQVAGVDLRRTIVVTKDWLLIVDDLTADQPRSLTWLCHADAPFVADGSAWVSKPKPGSLAVMPLNDAVEIKAAPAIVMAGKQVDRGEPVQRGYQLSQTMKSPAKSARLVNLLVPLASDQRLPELISTKLDGDTVAAEIRRPDGQTEKFSVTVTWKSGPEPVTMGR